MRLTTVMLIFAFAAGCSSSRTTEHPAAAFYQHRYPSARDAVRAKAADRRSTDVVLDNMRLGTAALADGDLDESERALMRAYEYLTSGQVNAADRTITSTLLYEGIRVWKGEPYEQAMSFYYIAALYMIRGDFENARAAAANALFPLRDFKEADMGAIARESARRERQGGGEYFQAGGGYQVVESQFTLGHLIAAASYVVMGQREDATRMFEHVRGLRPDLRPLADALEQGGYDTLLLVDVGKGPRKVAYGPDHALVKFVPDGRFQPPLRLSASVDGKLVETPGSVAVVDLWQLSQHPRWWSLEGMRQAKSTVGNVLLFGGLGAAAIGGAGYRNKEAAIAGLSAAALGALLKSTSAADVRHLETLPRCVFLVPLTLGPGVHNVHLHFDGDSGSDATWHDLRAGSPGKPAIYYMRMHNGNGAGMPRWAHQPLYSVSAEQYRGAQPYVLGGTDVTPPDQAILDAYHRYGVLANLRTVDDLTALYRSEGVVFTPGPQGDDDRHAANDEQLFRHITDGGRALFVPRPGSHAYERVTRLGHRPYQSRGNALKMAPTPTQARSGK